MATNINQIKRNALEYVKEIGKGAYSTIYMMTWRSPDGPINVAAKKLNRKDQHELEVLSELDHPNIINLIGVVDEGTEFMLVLELCEGGSLRSYLKARNGRRLPAKQFYDWAEQAARPLEYLRENKWIHNNVNSDNYMITSQNTLKLGDFGLAKNIDQTVDNATTTASYNWMAPDLLLEGILSPKYDIFALAIVLWELWTGRLPWEEVKTMDKYIQEICIRNKRLAIPEDCPEPIKALLRQCWQEDRKQRPDIIQVLHVITTTAAVRLQTTATAAAKQSLAAAVASLQTTASPGAATSFGHDMVTKWVENSEGGSIYLPDEDVQVIVPRGALESSTRITVTTLPVTRTIPPREDLVFISPIVSVELKNQCHICAPIELHVQHSTLDLTKDAVEVWSKADPSSDWKKDSVSLEVYGSTIVLYRTEFSIIAFLRRRLGLVIKYYVMPYIFTSGDIIVYAVESCKKKRFKEDKEQNDQIECKLCCAWPPNFIGVRGRNSLRLELRPRNQQTGESQTKITGEISNKALEEGEANASFTFESQYVCKDSVLIASQADENEDVDTTKIKIYLQLNVGATNQTTMKQLKMVEEILLRSTVNICNNLDPGQLLLIMQSEQALTPNDVDHIQSKVSRRDQSAKLVDILMHKPAKSYHVFMDALLQIGRKDIYDSIEVIEREVGYTRHQAGPSGDSSASISPGPLSAENLDEMQTAIGQSKDVQEVNHQTITSLLTAAALEARQGQNTDGPLELVREFGQQDGPGKLLCACHMVLSPDGDVVIADHEASQIKIYSFGGQPKSSIDTKNIPNQIAVSSDNTCFITDRSQHITMYELSGKYKGSWESSCPCASSLTPGLQSVTIDHACVLLLGDTKNNYIYKHRQDGTHVASIKVGIAPIYIAVASQGTIVIADWCTTRQVISNTGQVLHTLPVRPSDLSTISLYCHDDIIFVAIQDAIVFYNSKSGKYLGSRPIPSPVRPYRGLAVTSDRKELLVCDGKSVKVYTTPLVQQ